MASTPRTVAQIQADLDRAMEQVRDKDRDIDRYRKDMHDVLNAKQVTASELRGQAEVFAAELREAQKAANPQPFDVGDIVEDEVGVRYRVTRVGQVLEDVYDRRGRWVESVPGVWNAEGIRLTATGIEAHVKPRLIRSPKLTVVTL